MSDVKMTIKAGGRSVEVTPEQLERAADAIAGAGHNLRIGGIAADQLLSIIQRIERLEEEKAGLGADITQVYAEAKGNGFCSKTIRTIVKLRKQDAADRDEAETMLDTYLRALGMKPQLEMFEDTPPAGKQESSNENDDLYQQAVDIVRRDDRASTSYLQRCLKIGFNRASDIIEQLETNGIVTAADHLGKRKILPASTE